MSFNLDTHLSFPYTHLQKKEFLSIDTMGTVRLEIMPGLSRYFAAGFSGLLVLEREVSEGATVRDLLDEITSRNTEYKNGPFNVRTGKLAGHLSVILNGRFLELSGGLEAKLKPGDTIRLMLGFSGG